jgi:hypothetical protein
MPARRSIPASTRYLRRVVKLARLTRQDLALLLSVCGRTTRYWFERGCPPARLRQLLAALEEAGYPPPPIPPPGVLDD